MNKKKQNASDIVYKVIEQKILDKEWEPGMKISSENQLSQELGVSRLSVREAIEKMVALSILNKKQGEGTFVKNLDASIPLSNLIPMILLEKDNQRDILEFRLILEVESVKLFTSRGNAEMLQELEKCYQDMCRFQDDSEKFYSADYGFHSVIAKGTGNSLIVKINSIMTDLLSYHQKTLNVHLGPEGGLKDHKKILEAIREKDPELAGLYMKRHIERTIRDYTNLQIGSRNS